MDNKVIKIMLIGDNLIFRKGLRRLIETQSCFVVESETEDISGAITELNKKKPDVLVINSKEAEEDDFQTFPAKYCGSIPILVLTHSTESQVHQKYLMLGAGGVVTKYQRPELLFKAIKHVYQNELWFERKVLLQTITELIEEKRNNPRREIDRKYKSLTEREWEVLNGVCLGMKNKTLAESLFITETTIRHHLTSIFEKPNVKNRLALAILAYNDGVIEVPVSENSQNLR